jgi:hypothetical protein
MESGRGNRPRKYRPSSMQRERSGCIHKKVWRKKNEKNVQMYVTWVRKEVSECSPQGDNVPYMLEGPGMSKITYWKCVDCNSMINDENIHENGMEFCYGCMNYNPEVVLAYD